MKTLLLLSATWLAFSLPGSAQEIPEVRTVIPVRANTANDYEIPGRTAPIESATIFTRATGIIRERRFDIGQVVQAGEILAVVDAPEIDREVEAAEATVEQTQARVENARNLSERSDRLLKSQAISTEESDQRRIALMEMQAGLKVAQAELARLRQLQSFSTVKAPFAGVITARNFDRGDHVRGDDAAATGWLYRLERLDTLRFVISATPDLALRLEKESEAVVRFGEFPAKQFKVRVANTSRVFETSSGTMRVELWLDNKDLLIPSGLTGAVKFKLPPAEGTFLIPANALLVKEGKSRVAVLGEGKVRFLEVMPGRNFGREIEVVSAGLSERTPVILNPNAMLREGDPVAATPLTAAK